MDFEMTSAHREWIEEVQEFLDTSFGPEARAEALEAGREWNDRPAMRAFRTSLARKGWLGVTLPPEYGGLGRSTFEQFLLMDEFAYWGAPSIDLSSAAVGPTILRHGSPEQRRTWLPRIIRGDVEFAIGYSEPDAGTDLASLRTKAEPSGTGWVINGEPSFGVANSILMRGTAPPTPRTPRTRVNSFPLYAMCHYGHASRLGTDFDLWDNKIQAISQGLLPRMSASRKVAPAL